MENIKNLLDAYLENRAFRYEDEDMAREIAEDIINYLKEELNDGIHEIDNGHIGTSEA